MRFMPVKPEILTLWHAGRPSIVELRPAPDGVSLISAAHWHRSTTEPTRERAIAAVFFPLVEHDEHWVQA